MKLVSRILLAIVDKKRDIKLMPEYGPYTLVTG